MAKDTVFITAATGNQSSALIRALSTWSSEASIPITLHALTRSPSSPSAQRLLSYAHNNCDIKLFKGDFDDVESLKRAAESCTSAFLNVLPIFSDSGAEKRHAENVISALVAVAATTLRRITYTSSHIHVQATYKPGSFMEGFAKTKTSIEEAVANAGDEYGFDWTVLRPSFFLSNLLPPSSAFVFPELSTARKIIRVSSEYKLSAANMDDLGKFAAASLTWTGERYSNGFKGKCVPFANEIMSFAQILETFNEQLREDPCAQGVQVELLKMERDEAERLRGSNPLIELELSVLENPSEVNIEKVVEFGIPLSGVRGFWGAHKDEVRKAVGL